MSLILGLEILYYPFQLLIPVLNMVNSESALVVLCGMFR